MGFSLMKKMDICLISDDNYVEYMATLIVSVLKNSCKDDKFHFHVIDTGIKSDSKEKLIDLKNIKDFEISFYISPNIEKYKKWAKEFKEETHLWWKWHYSILTKLDIPFIFKNLDNILFLDSDMIVLTQLNKFYEIDMSDYYIATIQGDKKCLSWISENSPFFNWMNEIGCEKREYVGTGLFFINLKLIRDKYGLENYQRDIDICFNKYKNTIFTEEHIFLYVFKKFIAYIDYNANICLEWRDEEQPFNERDIKIMHFKPLSKKHNYELNDGYNKFWEYFSETMFFKENYFKYMNIFAYNASKMERNKIIEAINKIVDIIVYPIPFRKVRHSIRNKINDILN